MTDHDQIITFYTQKLRQHGVHPRSVDWGSRASQYKRFTVLTQIDDLQNKSVLDVGCGLGDLYAYLQEREHNVQYTGYDITPGMVEHARERFPSGSFSVHNIMQDDVVEPQFDYVLASGIFYLLADNPTTMMQRMVKQLYALCHGGLAFNTLSTHADTQELGEFYADPAQTLAMCLEITPRVTLRHDYMPHDFTVYMYR